MSLFASDFGGPLGFFYGGIVLVLVLALGVVWIVLQARSLLRGERLSWLALAFLVAFSAIPGLIVFTTLQERHAHVRSGHFLFFLCLGGLFLLPCTLTREYLKFRRDRQPPRRRRG
jgi:hypothetical protein